MISDEKIIENAQACGTTKWFGTLPDGTNEFRGASFDSDQFFHFARSIYEQGRADQRESDEKLCRLVWGDQFDCAEVIRNNTGDLNES